MAQEEFEEERLTKREKNSILIRSISNYIFGGIIIIAGCLIIVPNKYTAQFVALYDPLMIKLFAVICWIYGAFRLYRGYNKNV
jgi:hypothetical protein